MSSEVHGYNPESTPPPISERGSNTLENIRQKTENDFQEFARSQKYHKAGKEKISDRNIEEFADTIAATTESKPRGVAEEELAKLRQSLESNN